MTFINSQKAKKEALEKGIQCCSNCIFLDDYETDLESIWECVDRGDIELMDAPYENVFKHINCDFFKRLLNEKSKAA